VNILPHVSETESLARKENQARVNFVMSRLKDPVTKFTLVVGLHGCTACIILILNGFSFWIFVAVCADNFETPVSCARFLRSTCKPSTSFIQLQWAPDSDFWPVMILSLFIWDSVSSFSTWNYIIHVGIFSLIFLWQLLRRYHLNAYFMGKVQGCIQKFLDWVDSEINNNNKHSLRSNTKDYGSKTH